MVRHESNRREIASNTRSIHFFSSKACLSWKLRIYMGYIFVRHESKEHEIASQPTQTNFLSKILTVPHIVNFASCATF